MAKEKKETLDSVISALEKEDELCVYNGKEAALKDERMIFDAPRLSWAYGGSFKLNAIHRFNGKESGGKTTLCTYIAGQCQKHAFEKYGNYDKSHVVILDYERSFDVIHALDLGLLLEDPTTGKPLVHVLRKKYVEDGQAAWERLMSTGQICCTIYDSDAAGACHTELDNEIGKANFGALAKANGINIKRMNIYVDQYVSPVLWISQERANQELMAHLPKCVTGDTRVTILPKADSTEKLNLSIDDFVKELRIDTSKLQPGEVIDLSMLDFYTPSINLQTNVIENKKILNIKYQGMKEVSEIRMEDETCVLQTSKNHHLYDWKKLEWVEVGKVGKEGIQIKIGDELHNVVASPSITQKPMWDFEVADNHNYFTNNILSKNCTGGEAVNFFPSTRFRVTPKETITKNGEIVGIKMKIKNYKNKTGIPSRECFLDVYFKDGEDYKKGIDADGQYLDMALELGMIVQHGAWFYYKENTPDMIKMQGWGGVQQWFTDNPNEFGEVKKIVNTKLSGFDEVLDKNTVAVDEEVEFQKEQLEVKAKREAAIASLADEALKENNENEEE